MKKLKVLISGTGFAGQGHTDAFRNVGAEVVGIVGRTERVLVEVAKKKSILYANTDWEQALNEKNCECLAREFAKDIKGEPYAPYLSFKEGSLYQQLTDIIRKNNSWKDVSHLS